MDDVIQLLAAEGEKFNSPGPRDFEYPGIIGGFTKSMLIIVLGTLFIAIFMYVAARRAAMVPNKTQFAGESAYGFVRNSIALDAIGPEGLRFVPYLATLFFYIAILNLSGILPILQFPATSRIAIPLSLALIS